MLPEEDDVVGALPQGRQRERHQREPMVEVLAEAPEAARQEQVVAGRRDDLHIDRLVPRGPEAPHRAVVDGGEELGLERQREEAHLVEQHGPVLGELEQAGLPLPRVGERPPLVAEQLGLEQGLGDRGAVHGNEGAVGARTRAVNDARHQPLARAGLAEDQDGRKPPGRPLALDELLYRFPDGDDPFALADQCVHRPRFYVRRGDGGGQSGEIGHLATGQAFRVGA
ncbi:MAG: hypothetical protein L0027_04310 [Candidatus Rokubacteria bacterium]|nr:hypothetical protein [Candidatus Rokubacteria bacterium]